MSAFVFVPLLALFAMILYVTLIFTSHHFLTVVESTAHGNEEVDWPSEGFLEWLWKPFYLAALAAIWGAPSIILGLLARKYIGIEAGIFCFILAFMLLYPVGQLSAFVAEHPWTPLHHDALFRLALKPHVTASFGVLVCFLAPFVLLGLVGSLRAGALRTGGPIWGSLILAAVMLLYARLLGRLLFVLTYEKPEKLSEREETPLPVIGQSPPPPKRRKRDLELPVAKRRPEGVEQLPALRKVKPAWDDDDDTPYGVHQSEVEPEKTATPVVKPQESEMKLLERTRVKPPTRTWGPEVWSFLGQTQTWVVLVIQAFFLALLTGCLALLGATRPF